MNDQIIEILKNHGINNWMKKYFMKFYEKYENCFTSI